MNLSDNRGTAADYGEGKTREQEASDSATMLALVLAYCLIAAIVVGLAVWLWA